jgi:hypothetical protein
VFYLTGQQQEQNNDLQCKGRPGRVKMVSPLATLLRRRPVVEMVKLQVEAGATLPDRCQRIEKIPKSSFRIVQELSSASFLPLNFVDSHERQFDKVNRFSK